MLGIGGTGMGSLAGLLVEAGHTVTGTDEKLYPPMSEQIASLNITPFEGYRAENIAKAGPELVIIGNVIRKENPEAQEILKKNLPYMSMPAALSELFLKNKTSVVIAGTHGKTSTANLAAWTLESAGEHPSFLIGGVGLNLGKSYKLNRGTFFVIEGDEYDTAFFDKGPKFLHYRPQGVILTSIEFDHADIYRNLEHIMESFQKLVAIVPPDGVIVANFDDANVKAAVRGAKCRVVSYGIDSGTYRPHDIDVTSNGTSFSLKQSSKRFTLPMWGTHNLSNAVGVVAILMESGVSAEKIAKGLASFKGIRRRQEIVGEVKGVIVIDDFAHHPTAVEKTIESMRLRFPGRRLWAIFEPRSNTSKRNIFQKEFTAAFSKADRVILARPFKADQIPLKQRLNVEGMAASLMKSGIDSHFIPETEHIVEFVIRGVDTNDVILIMSNGGFDGLHQKLIGALKKRRFERPKTPSKIPK